MANTKKYWKGLEQLENDSSFADSSNNEFAEHLPVTEFLEDKENLGRYNNKKRLFKVFRFWSSSCIISSL